MTSLVCGNRSVLAWHMQLQAAQAGHTLEVVDPRVFLATIPTDDDIDVICDDAENDDANSGTSSLPAGSPIARSGRQCYSCQWCCRRERYVERYGGDSIGGSSSSGE